MKKIPANIKARVNDLIPDGVVFNETVAKTKLDNPARRIEFEIGDSKQSDFYPQFKTKHWDNECNFSARLVSNVNGQITDNNGKLAYDDGEKIARFYEKDTGDEDGGFEFDVVLPAKPTSNVLEWTIEHKELDFFYQRPLTQEEIDEGGHQPDNIIGSYAVYNKSKRNNKVGGKEYRTGKAFHIYRPYAEDSNGGFVWCDLQIDTDTNRMTVTIPQDFLDNAAYPVIVDPTIGYTTIGATGLNATSDRIQVSAYLNTTDGTGGTVSDVRVYGSQTAGSGSQIAGAIYDSSNNLLSPNSSPQTVSTSDQWNVISFSGPTLSASTSYKVCVFYDVDASNSFGYQTDFGSSGDGENQGSVTAFTWPDPLSAAANTFRFSIYATYSASTEYTLTAAAGTLDLAGTASGLDVALKLTAAAKAMTFSGSTSALVVNRLLSAATGSISLTGQSVNLVYAKSLTAEAGLFSISGSAASLTVQNKLTAAAGSLTFSGTAASLTTGDAFLAESGTFTLSGPPTNLQIAMNLTAGVGSLSFSGGVAGLTRNYALTAASGAFSVAGSTAVLTKAVNLTAASNALSLAGSDASLYTALPESKIFINLDTNEVMYKISGNYFINL